VGAALSLSDHHEFAPSLLTAEISHHNYNYIRKFCLEHIVQNPRICMSFFKIAQLFFFPKRKKKKEKKKTLPPYNSWLTKAFFFFPLNFVMLLKW
jgi:hypothetical protein